MRKKLFEKKYPVCNSFDEQLKSYVKACIVYNWVIAHEKLSKYLSQSVLIEIEQMSLRLGLTYRTRDGRVLVNRLKWREFNYGK